MANSDKEPRPPEDLAHLSETIERAKRAAKAAMDANEPPGAERIPEQDDDLVIDGGDFPAGMSQPLNRAAERMRRGWPVSEDEDEGES
jgi:hypothetical protein